MIKYTTKRIEISGKIALKKKNENNITLFSKYCHPTRFPPDWEHIIACKRSVVSVELNVSKTYLTFHDDFPSYFTEACLRVVFVQDFSYGPPHRSTASDRNFGVRPANILLRTGVRCHGGGFSIASNPSREQLRNSSTRVSRSHSIISPIAYYFCGEIRIRRRLKRIVFVRVHTHIYIFFLSFFLTFTWNARRNFSAAENCILTREEHNKGQLLLLPLWDSLTIRPNFAPPNVGHYVNIVPIL